jgi:hypothetical protein
MFQINFKRKNFMLIKNKMIDLKYLKKIKLQNYFKMRKIKRF